MSNIEIINQKDFAEFLHCCRTEKRRRIHLAESCLVMNLSAADFGSIVIEFESCMYFLTAKNWNSSEDEPANELSALKISSLEDIKDEITEDIFKTFSYAENELSFTNELIGEDGYLEGLEFKTDDYFLYIVVDTPILSFTAHHNEELRYLCYEHQFHDGPTTTINGYVELFPEG